MANQNWNDWKFQIYWNKLEWVNPRSHIEQKIHFVCLLKNSIFKIILKLHIGLVALNKTPLKQQIFKNKEFINYLQPSLTKATIEQSDYGMENNPYLLQEAGVENYDAYLTADVGKID